MNQKIKAGLAFLAAASVLVAPQTASAAGFYISEVGTPGSLGTAGVANPTNTFGPDSSWTNPAGMTGLQKDTITGGLQLIIPKVEFDSSVATSGGGDGGNAGSVLPVPSFFYVNKLSDRFRLGFSVAAIQGGGVDYGENFVGRYSVTKAELGAIGISPSIGYKVNDRFSVGAGVSFVYTRFDQDIMINPAIPGGTTNGQDGKLKIVEATDWDNPQTLNTGLKYQLDDKNTLFLNAGWEEWSAFSKNKLSFSGGLLNPVGTLDPVCWWNRKISILNEGNTITVKPVV